MPPFSRIKVRASVPSFAMAKGGNREMTGEEGGEKEREREREREKCARRRRRHRRDSLLEKPCPRFD